MKTLKKVLSIVLVFLFVLSFFACKDNSQNSNNEIIGTHEITDHLGNKVNIPDKIEKIAIADIYPLPSVLAIFFDSASKIVGMSENSMNAAKNSLLGSLYPEILNASTSFTDGTNINVEELSKLNPDIVFYSASYKAQGEQLKNAGFNAVAVSADKWNYNAIETLNNWIKLLCEIFEDNGKAEKVSSYSQKVYDMVQDRVKNLKESEKQKVFFLFQYSETNIMTSGKNFFGQWWADAIGAMNVGEELTDKNSVAVNMEQIYKWNPSLIFITNFTPAKPDDLYNNSIGGNDWSVVDAVKNQNVYKMPLGMYRSYTAGVDTPITIMYLAKCAYPDLFEDIDITKETVNYYKEVFDVELTNEQANQIFKPLDASIK